MAWRNIMASIFEKAISYVEAACLGENTEPASCARALVAAADALYTPLKPVDSGLGEARRIAGILSGLVANTFLCMASQNKDEEFIKAVRAELEEAIKIEAPLGEVKAILKEATAATLEPAKLDDARETLLNDIRDYVEPPQPTIPRRRRRQPRRPDPAQNLRRLVRELGRRDPTLAKQIARLLKAKSVPA